MKSYVYLEYFVIIVTERGCALFEVWNNVEEMVNYLNITIKHDQL